MTKTAPEDWDLHTILLATDGSDFGEGAARVEAGLAAATGARVAVLCVAMEGGEPLVAVPEAGTEAERAAFATAASVAAQLRQAGATADPVVRRGLEPALAIVGAAEELGADLVILGRRGKRNLARRMLGDATAKVICRAGCPVLVCPRGAVMWGRRILVATDGSSAAEGAVKAAGVVAGACGLGVTVLSVKVPKHPPERQAEAANIVNRGVKALTAAGVVAEGRVGAGLPPDEITAAAADCGADLVVMGSEGRTAIGRLLIGSNSQDVIGRLACPVLVTAPGTLRAPRHHRNLKVLAEAADRTFLVVADDTPEMAVALEYACRRARGIGGRVALLRVVPAEEFKLFGNVRNRMHADAMETAERLLAALAAKVEEFLGSRPRLFVREGDPCTEVLKLLDAEQSITALVLATGHDPAGPGTLVTQLATRHAKSLPVPLTIVPGHLSENWMKGLG